jgi:hypothetical protein
MQRLEVSRAVQPLQWSLGVKGLTLHYDARKHELKTTNFLTC